MGVDLCIVLIALGIAVVMLTFAAFDPIGQIRRRRADRRARRLLDRR